MGGTPSPPPQPTPMEDAQAQIAIQQEQARIDEQNRIAAEQREAKELADRIAKAQGKQTQAFDNAVSMYDRLLAGAGIDRGNADSYGVSDYYLADLESARSGLAEDDLNPNFATRTIFNDALDSGTTKYRKDLTGKINTGYGDGFAYDLFADTADDAVLASILDSQKSDAMQRIDAQLARGQLNETGYDRALSELNNVYTTSMADLQNIGGGVLSGYRDDLRSARDSELDKIGMLTLGDSYNFDGFDTRMQDRTNTMMSSLEGDIRAAIGDQMFIDPDALIAKGGSHQGFVNPSNMSIAPVTDPSTQKKDTVSADPTLNKNLVF
jgi:hypothetical protein